jgi:hypothetical protein
MAPAHCCSGTALQARRRQDRHSCMLIIWLISEVQYPCRVAAQHQTSPHMIQPEHVCCPPIRVQTEQHLLCSGCKLRSRSSLASSQDHNNIAVSVPDMPCCAVLCKSCHAPDDPTSAVHSCVIVNCQATQARQRKAYRMVRTKLELAQLLVSQHSQEHKRRCWHTSYHCLATAAVYCTGNISTLTSCNGSSTASLLLRQLL